MADLASEHDAAIELMRDEYRRLQKHEPNHDMLKFIGELKDDEFRYSSDEKIMNEFLDKYAPGDTTATVALANYYVALRNTVDKIEGIDRSPKEKIPIMGDLESKIENDW